MTPTQIYGYDVYLSASLQVPATSEDEARAKLRDCLDCADANLGAWPNGQPILAEVSLHSTPSLYAIDGDEVPFIKLTAIDRALDLIRILAETPKATDGIDDEEASDEILSDMSDDELLDIRADHYANIELARELWKELKP